MRELRPGTETTATGCSERGTTGVLKKRSAEVIATLISIKRFLTSLLAAKTPEEFILTFASCSVMFTGYSADRVSHVNFSPPLETPFMRAIEEVIARNNHAAR